MGSRSDLAPISGYPRAMSLRAILVLFVASLVGSARAEAPPPHRIVYDLALDGKPIGTRTLTVRYLPREDGERRVLEVYTDATVIGQKLVVRASGQSGPRGANFTSSVDQAGALSQVQGIELPTGGWRVTVADGAGVRESTYTKDEVRLTSLDLLDPGRTALLTGGGDLELLLVETGEVLVGALDAGQVGTTKVANQKIPVTRYTATGALGNAKFDIDANGLLLKSELRWLGGTVSAVARDVPPPRIYGTIEGFEPLNSGITEDRL